MVIFYLLRDDLNFKNKQKNIKQRTAAVTYPIIGVSPKAFFATIIYDEHTAVISSAGSNVIK